MYAYYLWVETLNSTVCGEYLQMERACKLQQDDSLLREQQQEKANDGSAISNRTSVKTTQGLKCAGLNRGRKQLRSSESLLSESWLFKLVKCYIWGIALYGAETWKLRAVDQKHLKSFEM